MANTLTIDNREGVRHIWMDRAEQRNALNAEMIAELHAAFTAAATDEAVRVIVIGGRGKAFCAGADLHWMREAAACSEAENQRDAEALAAMLHAIHSCPRPVIARVHGPAVGGGVGIVAACDIAIATDAAWFQLSEVRLGLIPATIVPYVISALGVRTARRWMLTAERFDATAAHSAGMIAECVPVDALDTQIGDIITALRAGGPAAHAATKEMISEVANRPLDAELRAETARRIAMIRTSAEGREGIQSFLEQREPRWRA